MSPTPGRVRRSRHDQFGCNGGESGAESGSNLFEVPVLTFSDEMLDCQLALQVEIDVSRRQ
jgi:hypothetical protein